MKTLNAFTQFVVLLSLPLLLWGCGEERDLLKEGFKYSESELNYQHYTEDIGPPRYVAGKAYTGRLYELFDNGELSEEGYYRKGYLNGVRRSWYEHGQQKWESNWKAGKQDGLETMWLKNGQKQIESHWKNGKKVSGKSWTWGGELTGDLGNSVGVLTEDFESQTDEVPKPKGSADLFDETRNAAEGGNAVAQYNLGVMYYNGTGVERNVEESTRWYRKAAEQGDPYAQCAFGLALDDDEEALKWFRKAAEQGNSRGQYLIAQMYTHGKGVPKNIPEALEWFRKATEQGDVQAQYWMGVMYSEGREIPKDLEEGVKWFTKAAEQGDSSAQYYLGAAYTNGDGAEQDEAEGFKWMHQAAKGGNLAAQAYLGRMYFNGEGVGKDQNEAIRWWRKASKQGDKEATELLQDLANGRAPGS